VTLLRLLRAGTAPTAVPADLRSSRNACIWRWAEPDEGMLVQPKTIGQRGHSGLARENSAQKMGDGTLELEPFIRFVKVEDHGPAIRVIIVSPPVKNLAIDGGAPRDEAALLRVQRIGNRYSVGHQQ
jgi:hypothetical protein